MVKKLILLLSLLTCWSKGDPKESSRVIQDVDAVVQKRGTFHLFKYSPWAWLPLKSEESLKRNSGSWKRLVKPFTGFVPRQISGGASQNFLVWESGRNRIWQFDSAFQTLSSLALPEDFSGMALEGYEMSYSPDQKFNFINGSQGSVLQFVEFGGKLRLHRKIKIPLGAGLWVPVRWPGKNDFSVNPYAVVTPIKTVLYSAFFIPSQPFYPHKDRPEMGKELREDMSPTIFWRDRNTPVYRYHQGGLFICYIPLKGEVESCPENP